MSDNTLVAYVDGPDDSRKFFTAVELERRLSKQQVAWFTSAAPGDMYFVKNGGYFPGTDMIVVKLSGVVG